jgi:transcription elongation factor GreA
MDKVELKQHLIEHHEHIIEDLQAEIDSYHTAADLDEDDTMDPEDYAHQSEAQFVERSLTQQLNKTQAELDYLKKLTTKTLDELGPGSLVEFKDRCIYVSVPSLPFEHKNKNILCISMSAPIFNLLKGKSQGDSVKLGKERLEILSIS